jgi:hypothetical protein
MSFAAATNCERPLRPTEAAAEPSFRDHLHAGASARMSQAFLLETMLAMPSQGLAGCNSIAEWTRPKVFTFGPIVWL